MQVADREAVHENLYQDWDRPSEELFSGACARARRGACGDAQVEPRQGAAFFAQTAPCRVGMEACGSSHYWAREIRTLGHEVVLIPPAYTKPYVKRGKNDANDAAAICEAMSRPDMRFVPIKSADQQAVLMLHKTRELLVKQRTMTVNALRGHLGVRLDLAQGHPPGQGIAGARASRRRRNPSRRGQASNRDAGFLHSDGLDEKIDDLEKTIAQAKAARTRRAGRCWTRSPPSAR